MRILKTLKFNFSDKLLLKTTSLVVLEAFLFNALFMDLAWGQNFLRPQAAIQHGMRLDLVLKSSPESKSTKRPETVGTGSVISPGAGSPAPQAAAAIDSSVLRPRAAGDRSKFVENI